MAVAFIKLVLSFAPWIAFMVIAQGSFFRLELGLVVALVVSVGMGLARLHRGVILWVGLTFFSYATLAVLVFANMWTVRHMGVLANGALAAGAWLTIALGKPFSLDYAREHTDPALWNDPAFVRSNVIITAAWAATFSVNAGMAWAKMEQIALPDWGYEVLSYLFLLGTAAFTTWYPGYLRRLRLAAKLP
jgi:hypothetical protein